nr:flagellar hook-length control protein FliK [uncultured Halomonas sp.]
MEISQLLSANAAPASSAAKGTQDTPADGADFAKVLKQSGDAVSGKEARETANAAEPGNESLAQPAGEGSADMEALAKFDGSETLPEPMDATASVADTPIIGLSPLTQNIAQAISTQLTPQPTQPSVIAETLVATPTTAAAALAGGEAIHDLAAIRERLAAIANAQRDTTPLSASTANVVATLPTAEQTALGIARPALRASAEIASLTDRAVASRHHSSTAQGMQPTGSQNVATTAPAASQPATFMDAIATPPAVADSPMVGRSGEGHTAQAHVPTGSLAGTTTGASAQAQAAPAQVLNAPLATPQWQQGLGQQVVALHQRGAQQMELHLRPADLGALTISLKVDDQLAQLQLFSANPHVRTAIEQAIPQLREALGENGIQLGEAMVGEHHQPSDDGSRPDNAALASRDELSTLSGEDADLATSTARPLAGNGNAVDLYA